VSLTRFWIVVLGLYVPVAAAQSLLHIQVLEGEGAVHSAGSKSERGPVVQVTDESGNPAGGVTVSFRLPDEGPTGTFSRGMKTDLVVTTEEGRAAVYDIVWNRMPGPLSLRVTAVKGEVRAGTVIAQSIVAGPARKNAAGARRGRGKWIAIAAAVGGGAAAGAVILGRSKPAPATSPPTPPPQIGPPAITIGRP
jgi:hypothetical protein